jgi:hypothetical protein
MAAAFNLPMISYFCTNYETSNKKDFPTFARTRPPDTQIAKSVVSLLIAHNWTRVTFLYFDHDGSQIVPIAKTVVKTLTMADIKINSIKTWNVEYHHRYGINPFDDLVRDTFRDTRSKFNLAKNIKIVFIQFESLVYLILGQFYEHIGLMYSLQNRGLLDEGNSIVVWNSKLFFLFYS